MNDNKDHLLCYTLGRYTTRLDMKTFESDESATFVPINTSWQPDPPRAAATQLLFAKDRLFSSARFVC